MTEIKNQWFWEVVVSEEDMCDIHTCLSRSKISLDTHAVIFALDAYCLDIDVENLYGIEWPVKLVMCERPEAEVGGKGSLRKIAKPDLLEASLKKTFDENWRALAAERSSIPSQADVAAMIEGNGEGVLQLSSGLIRLIFLDVDGVLNTVHSKTGAVEPAILQRFVALVQKSGASIVFSTSWRNRFDMKALLLARLHAAGIPFSSFVGETPNLSRSGENRGTEISSWLCAHGYPEADVLSPQLSGSCLHWVVIDDMPLGCDFPGHFVKTRPQEGLTDNDVMKALQYLDISDKGWWQRHRLSFCR
eukprot:gnl/MRDRNA2_/MRDRNA2_231159_c0_seq1.p1 gnl/MRDRNA2_/MRDRNA2_231159_c0~~gnl/MRDRNA2_/MRDRNA2_231159_c0_seq1.p1  ORF type:complete len:304 (-),score=54.77 gnl/MRDRNA2_/MRDRNA2_231159_c0_seq1:16-927(-)